ncbi:MAG: hypothetical protein FLDDKLPJ_02377 [Phycisphaerae bacterium]|nr:hypothetical protein [Phycisphaerae bacterium]
MMARRMKVRMFSALLMLVGAGGCATNEDIRHQLRASDPSLGSRLRLPREFSKNGETAGQDFSLDLKNPTSLASSVPETLAGKDVAGAAGAASLPALMLVGVQDAAQAAAQKRIVVYTAGLRVVVADIREAMDRAEALSASMQGYVQEIDGDRIVLRIPAERFDDALRQAEALGEVSHREVKALDVTEEYVDLDARLRSAEKLRDRLLALLEKTDDVKAMLEVERELGRVNEEIERLTGRMNALRNKVAYSAISITFERVASRTQTLAESRRLPFYWLHTLRPEDLWR